MSIRTDPSPPQEHPPLSDPAPSLDACFSLTPREQVIVVLTARGLTAREIGLRLFISERTVESHRSNAMSKLRVRNRAQLVLVAVQRGLIPLDENPEGLPDDRPLG